MDIKRVILYALFFFICYSLWTNWEKEVVRHPSGKGVEWFNSASTELDDSSQIDPLIAEVESEKAAFQYKRSSNLLHVKTDVLDLLIDRQQGTILEAKLLDYPVHVEEKNNPFVLLKHSKKERYNATSAIFQFKHHKASKVSVALTSAKKSYILAPDQDELEVTLTGTNAQGLELTKRFHFKKGSYLVHISYNLINKGSVTFHGYMNTELTWVSPKEDKSSIFHMGSYTGASYSNPSHHRYQKVSFNEMGKANLNLNVTNGWVAMQQHYFLTAWIPPKGTEHRFYTRAHHDEFVIGSVGELFKLKPDQSKQLNASLYIGPELTDVLKTIAPNLDLTADYGWLWLLSSVLLTLLSFIHSIVGNWGWSIVLVTLLIKLAFYRLSAASYKSMATMRNLQPKLQALKERFGEDKAKMSQATMELYRQEKVNPLGGCLPILIQIPVFIALYWVLMESVVFRQAPFIGWINDLSTADLYHVLPVILGFTMLAQQKLNPTPPDPVQAKVMMFLPIVFTAILWNSPSGLVLYWIVQNTLSILQQWYITKMLTDKPNSRSKLAIAKMK